MHNYNLPLFFALFISLCGISFSQGPAGSDSDLTKYLGTWSFVKDDSYKGARDRDLYGEYVITIDQVGSKLRIVRQYVYSSQPYRREILVNLDGSGETNESADSNAKVDLIRSTTRLKKGAIIRILDDNVRPAGPSDTETFKVSEDGRRLRIERRYRPKAAGSAPEFFRNRIETDVLVLERVT